MTKFNLNVSSDEEPNKMPKFPQEEMRPHVLTLETFAALPMTWPEHLAGMDLGSGDGILIARIHSNCNRPTGDEDVLTRALVFIPTSGELARITIRRCHVESGQPGLIDYDKAYREILYAILVLPVLDLTEIPDDTLISGSPFPSRLGKMTE